ncbi:hypothetical protein [Thermostaphylospora chromogena]|uniref:Uncharacterized protein n=1 Tax=Thermostaphylospora chromogena TaxID=35622 RepID=A0A1H1I1B3_9ACTN|nr:hypothetical protein [Thermostaphylospora chromogena]SDR31507.1 hypothetical protein SAMN04489764_5067 [Thermostaphylospora chromogena]
MAANHPHPPYGTPAGRTPVRGSKASKVVALTTVGTVAVLIAAYCSAQNDRYDEVVADCVDIDSLDSDGSYMIVDEDYCDDDDDDHHHHYYGSHGAYRWYYGGVRRAGRVSGGTTLRPSDVRIVSRGGTVIQRGGFGGRGFSGS